MKISSPDSLEKLSYSQQQRMRFIESLACWEGSVQRQRICEVFHVTPNHITKDLARYRSLYPGNLEYDISSRTYRPGPAFKLHLSSGSAEEYLGLLRFHIESESTTPDPRFGNGISVISLPNPQREIDRNILREIVYAIRKGNGIQISYQSMSEAKPHARIVWPHALVFAGFRWHIRAYDSRRNAFRDFVLPRIVSVRPSALSCPVKPSSDVDWFNEICLEVIPNPKLSDHQQRVVAKEFGMRPARGGWIWSVKIRRCLVPYFLQWYGLDRLDAKTSIVVRRSKILRDLHFPDHDG